MDSSRDASPVHIRSKTLERVSDAVISINQNFEYTYLNPQAEQLLGAGEQSVLGKQVWEVFPDAVGSIAEQKFNEALETGKDVTYERFNSEVDRWFEANVYPDDDGLSVFFRDITDRKERELELKRYQRIVENVPVAIGMKTTGDDGATLVNKGMKELFHIDATSPLEDPILRDLYTDAEDRPALEAQLEEQGEFTDTEVKFETTDGDPFWGSVTATVEEIDGTDHIIGAVQDITERKSHEQRLDSLHRATREMVNAETPEEIAAIVNEAATDIIDFPLNGVHLYDAEADGLVPAVVSDQTRKLLGDPPTLDRGIAWTTFETGTPQIIRDIREAENPYNPETEIRSEVTLPLGDHGVLIVSSMEYDGFSESEVTLAKILASNAQTALDNRQIEQQLEVQRDNLELLNQMVNHDVANDLQPIHGFTAKIQQEYLDDDGREYTEKILRNVEHAVDLLATARELTETMLHPAESLQLVALKPILESQLAKIRSKYPNVTVSRRGPIPDVTVKADQMLASVFWNLLQNAITHNDAEHPEIHFSVRLKSDSVVVAVADNGPGIAPDREDAVFGRGEKGFQSQGAGIGLYLVDALVNKYGGDVSVDTHQGSSEPEIVSGTESGSVFTVTLPRPETDSAPKA